ncbi:MAG: hypothetical protein ACI92G_003547 [Candidatus Pelagisphaera sp.]|jgi:hypothetical protein
MFSPHPILNRAPLFLLALLFGSSISHATIERTISADPYFPLVTIEIGPTPGTKAYAIEETLGLEALPTLISHQGVYDALTHKIKWGPFLDENPRTLSYRLSGDEGTVSLSAVASYDGLPEGPDTDSLDLPDPNKTFIGQQFLNTEVTDFTRFEIDLNADPDQNGVGALFQYAFSMPEGILQGENTLSFERENSSEATFVLRGLVNGQAPDIIFRMEISEDFENWDPIESVLQEAIMTRKEIEAFPTVDEIAYPIIPLNTIHNTFFRLSAQWISSPDI